MAAVAELSDTQKAFLQPFLPSRAARSTDQTGHERPFVTLTYASSLDSMIALAPGARTALSGPESKSMTHYLRLHHDAILIGAGTAVVDDPGLNCRYPGATLRDQPQPVVVDPRRRWDVKGQKVVQLASEGAGKLPWIVMESGPRDGPQTDSLLDAGGELIVVSDEAGSPIPWGRILEALKQRGIDSVMIEGGATVINTLLQTPELIDAVIVTIAPTWLGAGGVMVSPPARTEGGERTNAAWLQQTVWHQFGSDAVLCGKLGNSRG